MVEGSAGGVALIRFPAESARRDSCRDQGVMRLLVLETGAEAPVCTDACEDWIRPPVSREDLQARLAALRARGSGEQVPTLDPNGVLHFRSRLVVLSPTETDLVAMLVGSFGQVVSRGALVGSLPTSPLPSRTALDLHIMRIRRRIRQLGLEVRTIWGLGYVLEPAAGSEPVPRVGGLPSEPAG